MPDLDDPCTLEAVIEKYRRMYLTHRPKLGRWFCCKHCYRNICPKVGADFSIIVCPKCGYCLAPMVDVCEAGSLQAWYDGVVQRFAAALS